MACPPPAWTVWQTTASDSRCISFTPSSNLPHTYIIPLYRFRRNHRCFAPCPSGVLPTKTKFLTICTGSTSTKTEFATIPTYVTSTKTEFLTIPTGTTSTKTRFLTICTRSTSTKTEFSTVPTYATSTETKFSTVPNAHGLLHCSVLPHRTPSGRRSILVSLFQLRFLRVYQLTL